MDSRRVRKNVFVGGLRTSVCLEGEIWEALGEVCRSWGLTVHQLCSMIDERRHDASRTSAIRAFIVAYFRNAANGNGVDLLGSLQDTGKKAGTDKKAGTEVPGSAPVPVAGGQRRLPLG